MRVAFEIFQDAFSRKQIKSYLRGLRTIGRTLGQVRDLDVFMEKATQYLADQPTDQGGLEPLLEAWQADRETARVKMLAYLDSQGYREFLLEFNAFLHTPGAGTRHREDDITYPRLVKHQAPTMIYDRLAVVRAYERVLAGASIEDLHALRIEFKRLRYTMEYFREVLGETAKAVISQIKSVQDHLGDLNDADVACDILRSFLEEWEEKQQFLPLIERQNPEPIVAYLAAKHAERHRLMVTFEETWNAFDRAEVRQDLALAVAVL
jgi:CHAD domain-containing protein